MKCWYLSIFLWIPSLLAAAGQQLRIEEAVPVASASPPLGSVVDELAFEFSEESTSGQHVQKPRSTLARAEVFKQAILNEPGLHEV